MNLDEQVPIVLWMARMAPVKNPRLALQVAKLLPEITFLMAGGGDLFEETRASAPGNVVLLGWVDAAEVVPVADVFLSTSLNEGIPYSLIEVQSCGVPIVAVDSGAISELVTNGFDGYLSSADADQIADAISKVLSGNEVRTSMAANSLASSAARQAKTEMAQSHMGVYRPILRAN